MPWFFYGNNGYPVGPRPSGIIHPGTIIMSTQPYGGTAPDGYLFCDGASYLKNDYLLSSTGGPGLYPSIGIIYGEADINHFNVPNFLGRMARGIITAAGGIGDPTVLGNAAISGGGRGGAKTHSHTTQNHSHPIASNHRHNVDAHDHGFTFHSHNLRNHIHTAGSIVIGFHTPPINSDTREDASGSPRIVHGDTNLPLKRHDHGGQMGGWTGLASASGDPTVSNGTSDDGTSSSVSTSTDFTNISGNSPSLGSTVSDTQSNMPPYFAVSFLIKI